MSTETPDYVATWNQFWRELCTNPDGSLNLDAIQRELHDYHEIFGEVSEVYDRVTNGRISKPNTKASAVIAEYEAALEGMLMEHDKERRENEEYESPSHT